MVNGWFVIAVVASIVVCCGFVIAIAIMKSAWAAREREALTSSDLRALEESAVYLIEQLKNEAESAITEIDKRRKSLSKLIKDADEKLLKLAEAEARASLSLRDEQTPQSHELPQSDETVKILELAETGMEPAEIAKATGITCAEVNLILNISKKLAA